MRQHQVQAEWRRAQKALQAAELLQQNGLAEDAISRAYYAVMHAAKAALLVHDVAVRIRRLLTPHRSDTTRATFHRIAPVPSRGLLFARGDTQISLPIQQT